MLTHKINVAKANGNLVFNTNIPSFTHIFGLTFRDTTKQVDAEKTYAALCIAYAYPEYHVSLTRVETQTIAHDTVLDNGASV